MCSMCLCVSKKRHTKSKKEKAMCSYVAMCLKKNLYVAMCLKKSYYMFNLLLAKAA